MTVQYIVTLVALLMGAHTQVLGAGSPVPGYGVDQIQWKVEIAHGQTEILNGTVQEVFAQVSQINTDFKPTKVVSEPVDKNEEFNIAQVYCSNWPLASKYCIQQRIDHLFNEAGGIPIVGPGPGNCGRFSRSYNAAIWLCNDNPHQLTLNNWHAMAHSARHLVNVCAPAVDQGSGQNFEAGNWNAIVRGDRC